MQNEKMYSQTCLKQAAKGKSKIACLREVGDGWILMAAMFSSTRQEFSGIGVLKEKTKLFEAKMNLLKNNEKKKYIHVHVHTHYI